MNEFDLQFKIFTLTASRPALSLSLSLVPGTPENRKRSSGEIFQSPNESNPGVNTPISGEPWVSGDSPAISGRSTTKERYRNTPLVLLFVLVPNLGSRVSTGAVKLRWWCSDKNGGKNTSVRGSSYIFAVLAGLLSSITGGISYCLTKAGSKASDQPLLTVFSFGLLASPASGVCLFAVEVFLARGLQLEKTGKVANVIYMEAALSQLWGIGSSRIALSLGRIIGCVLILISVSCTMYIGPDKDTA
ncbi:hypothetical protein DVH24_032380 [Malus domestica]|uniref:Uncharacterized protein n=1 Tax=Malus domestica TaxID=3750 RepID=A0A498J881_MALDO|nr:hypothetical protein DVH24_032380 [Malus domestica]